MIEDPEVGFCQSPPQLGDQYAGDRVLRGYLRRVLPPEVLAEIEPELEEMGRLAGGELYQASLADRRHEPVHVPWDAWGQRIDRIEVTDVWRRAERLAAEKGLVATAYERRHGRFSRIHQFALAYLFTPSTDLYSCPLAMTDGAARALQRSGGGAAAARALPHLLSRRPEEFWTSGQWMTETTGGSDVGGTETVARLDGETWHLWGRKWFTSAVQSQMALALARPEGHPPGSRGLALFYVETRDEDDLPNGIEVARLKDKLGTRKLPTAELLLCGVPALPVAGLENGVRAIAPMLNVTRTWNAVSAIALMRRGLALARDYARRRQAFGSALADKPLHADTLAGLQAEQEGAFHLTFRVVELLGLEEGDEVSAEQLALLRVLTPVAKLLTGRQAVAVASEVLEAFGGAGYVEDTGLPVLLRDAQVLPIWEGTTNVLSLDLLRAIEEVGGLAPVVAELERCLATPAPGLEEAAATAHRIFDTAAGWLEATGGERSALEAGARRFALALGRSLELALLVHHATWALTEGDSIPAAAARRFAAQSPDHLAVFDPDDAKLLLTDG